MCFSRRQTGVQTQPETHVRRGPEREHGDRVRGGRVPGAGRVQVDVQPDQRGRVRDGQQRTGAAVGRRRRTRRPRRARQARQAVVGAHVQPFDRRS